MLSLLNNLSIIFMYILVYRLTTYTLPSTTSLCVFPLISVETVILLLLLLFLFVICGLFCYCLVIVRCVL